MIRHRDYRSFYPSTTYLDEFPRGKFSLYYQRNKNNNDFDIKKVSQLSKQYCCIITFLVENCDIRKEVTNPSISYSKCKKVEGAKFINDNGRVLRCNGLFELTCTELDFEIILEQYNYTNIYIYEIYISKKGRLPDWFRNITKEYFYRKNLLKWQIENEIDEEKRIELEIEYMKSKNKLNAIYGMSATDIVRQEIVFNYDIMDWEKIKNEDISETLFKYYRSRNNFMSYQFGCWVTSNCRYRLHKMISEVVGYDNFIYADTDSIFYKSTPEIEKRIEDINEKNRKECFKNGDYVEVNGKKIEFMTFEDEKENITQFKFLHSKCYCYVTSDEKMHLTVAGVGKYWKEDEGKPYKERRTRVDELGSIENFKNNFVFKHCGKTNTLYCEVGEPKKTKIKKHEIEYGSSAIIRDGEVTLHDMFTNLDFYEFDTEHF